MMSPLVPSSCHKADSINTTASRIPIKLSMAENFIKLSQFLKFNDLVQSGGEAKHLIQDGHVLVNDEVELRRGRKLYVGDRVTFAGQTYNVVSDADSAE